MLPERGILFRQHRPERGRHPRTNHPWPLLNQGGESPDHPSRAGGLSLFGAPNVQHHPALGAPSLLI